MGASLHLLHLCFGHRIGSIRKLCLRELLQRVYNFLARRHPHWHQLSTPGKQGVLQNILRSIFQSVSVVGYCMLPIALLGLFVSLVPTPGWINLILMVVAMLWSTVSSMIVMSDLVS